MRMMFVISCLNYGGAEKNLMILANHFREDHAVAICNFNEKDTMQKVDSSIDYYEQSRWKASEKRFDWINKRQAQFRFLEASCKAFQPEILISFLSMPNTLAVLCGKKLHIPVIISERADPYRSVSKLDKIFHYIYGFADGAVFQTSGAKEFYPKKLQDRSVVIPNPVVIPQYAPQHNYEGVRKEIVCVGRFENKQKRQDLAIKAMKIIHRTCPDYKMVFWGDGEDLAESKALASALGLDGCIEFPGVTDTVLEKIDQSEIYLLTSDYEGIPNGLIEAMSIGMPCVSTDCSPGGAGLLLGNNDYGLVVPCGNEHAIADAVIGLIENKGTAIKYGKKARESLSRFAYAEIMERWDAYVAKTVTNSFN